MSYDITDFTAGEISLKSSGRVDMPMYRSACRTLRNAFVLPSGGATKRPGTRFVGAVKNHARAILVPWTLSAGFTYMLEIGHQYTRIWQPDGTLLQNGSAPVELSTPWTLDALDEIRWVQTGNPNLSLMYLVHSGYPVQKITRDAGVWTTGVVTFTAGVDEEDFGSVGRYPAQIEIYEDRLILAATDANPNWFYASKVGEYEDFTHGTNPNDAWSRPVQAKERPYIVWLAAETALTFGTLSGAWRLGGDEIMLTPDVRFWPRRQSSVGCSPVAALMVEDSVLFIQKAGTRIRRFAYFEPADKYLAADITIFADHLFAAGVAQMVYQRELDAVLWVRTLDSRIATMTYNPQVGILAWSSHDYGGNVESCAAAATAGEDEIWMIVRREIGGQEYRYIERTAPREFASVRDCVYLDSSITLTGGDPVGITSVQPTDPALVLSPAHGFSGGDVVRIRDTDGTIAELEQEVYVVQAVDAGSYELLHRDGVTNLDLSGYAAEALGGNAQRVFNIIPGLSHLEGEMVGGLSDGSVLPTALVESGEAAFAEYGNVVTVGLPFDCEVEPMPIALASHKIKRIVQLYGRFYRTFGALAGEPDRELERIAFETEAPIMGEPPELVTATLTAPYPGDFTRDARIRIVSDTPLPLTVLSITADVEQER